MVTAPLAREAILAFISRSSGDGVPLCGFSQTSTSTEECGPLEIRACLQRDKPVHHAYCPSDVPAGFIRRVARLGKRLVLPVRGSFLPHVGLDEAFGGVGKVSVLRYHPDCSSSHPALQVCFRCNFDVQCTDRVFVCSALREVIRRRRVKKSAACEHADVSRVDADVREEPAPSLVVADPQEQHTVFTPSHFRPRLRRSTLLGGVSLDDPEDFDIFEDEPEELFTEKSGAPGFEDLFQDDDFLESHGVSDPLVESKPMDQNLQDDPMTDMFRDLDEEAFVEHEGFKRVELKTQRRWSELIAAGKKKVEGRPNIGRAKRVNEGDYLVLNDVQCKVVRKRTFRSFRAMLEAQSHIDDVMPGFELEAAVRTYHEFPNYEQLAEDHGVVAFDIELTPDQPHWHGEKPVIVEQKELEEYNVPPHEEHLVDLLRHGRPWWRTAYEAFKRSYRVMSNIAHYQTDYATKSNVTMGNELSEQCIGVERLRKEEIRDGVRKTTVAELMEAGRKTLIRLQTAANRSALKKLPEMVFAMLNRHECYASHESWDHERFVQDLQKSEVYVHPLTLTKGKPDTFLETRFEMHGNQIRHWLKIENEQGTVNVWRYQHFASHAPYTQKRALLTTTLQKVHQMASDVQALYQSALAKIVEFLRLAYPRPMIRAACTYMAASRGERTWLDVRDTI